MLLKHFSEANWLLRFVCEKLFYYLDYPKTAKENIERLAAEGQVVIIHRSQSRVYFLAFLKCFSDTLLKHFAPQLKNTPLSQTHLSHLFLGNIYHLFLSEKNRKQPDLVFLNAMIEIQKKQEKPIYLMPHYFVLWSKPKKTQTTAADFGFWDFYQTNSIRFLLRLFLYRHHIRFECLTPIDLKAWLLEQQDTSNTFNLAQKLKFHLLKPMNRLEEALYGPPSKTLKRIEKEILRDRDLLNVVQGLAQQTGIPENKLLKKSEKICGEMAARIDVDYLTIYNYLLRFFWFKIYSGLFWNKEAIDIIRQKSVQGPLIFLPCHKSHADYIAISYVLFQEGLLPPLIAAGDNLSFFPLGFLFRKGGAFFIRRSFKGDVLYTQTVKAYLKKTLKEGYSHEFFIEGKRSRSGKMLPPKLGLLSIITDHLMQGSIQDAVFCPVAISYEKLAEGNAYLNELKGGEKSQENTGSLLKSVGIFRKTHGNVYVNFGKPFTFQEYIKEQNLSSDKIDTFQKQDLNHKLAYKIVHTINQNIPITPTSLIATALFASHKRCLSKRMLYFYVKKLLTHMKKIEGEQLNISQNLIYAFKPTIDQSLNLLLNDQILTQETIYDINYLKINEKYSLLLDYYRNNLIHILVPDAILALSFAVLGGVQGKKIQRNSLFKIAQKLSHILKYEFIYPIDRTFIDTFEKHIQLALHHNILQTDEKGFWAKAHRSAYLQIHMGVRLIKHFADTYFICAQKLESSVALKPSQKILSKNLLKRVRNAYHAGLITCPESVNQSIVDNFVLLMLHEQIISIQDNVVMFESAQREKFNEILNIFRKIQNVE